MSPEVNVAADSSWQEETPLYQHCVELLQVETDSTFQKVLILVELEISGRVSKRPAQVKLDICCRS